MVNADDGQWGRVLVVLDVNGDGGVVKGGVDVVDGDWIVGVRSVARDINDNTQFAAGLCQKLVVDERRDGLRQIDLAQDGQ